MSARHCADSSDCMSYRLRRAHRGWRCTECGKLSVKCSNCNGAGAILAGSGDNVGIAECPECGGNGLELKDVGDAIRAAAIAYVALRIELRQARAAHKAAVVAAYNAHGHPDFAILHAEYLARERGETPPALPPATTPCWKVETYPDPETCELLHPDFYCSACAHMNALRKARNSVSIRHGLALRRLDACVKPILAIEPGGRRSSDPEPTHHAASRTTATSEPSTAGARRAGEPEAALDSTALRCTVDSGEARSSGISTAGSRDPATPASDGARPEGNVAPRSAGVSFGPEGSQ